MGVRLRDYGIRPNGSAHNDARALEQQQRPKLLYGGTTYCQSLETSTMAKIAKSEALRVLATPYDAPYNFCNTHSVILDHPLSTVFPVLAHGDNIERLVRSFGLCTDFELYDADTVQTPSDAPLIESQVRTLTTSPSGFRRQFFRMEETIPLLFGLFYHSVNVFACQTWDEASKTSLYESVTQQGIIIWKLRTMEEIEVDGAMKCRVTEDMRGFSPWMMKMLVERMAVRTHV